jgi:hypothetical protein
MTSEACNRAVTIRETQGGFTLSNIAGLGHGSSPPTGPADGYQLAEYGLKCEFLHKDATIEQIHFFGHYSRAAIITPKEGSYRNVLGENGANEDKAYSGSKNPIARAWEDGRILLNWRANHSANRALTPAIRNTLSFIPDLQLRGINGFNIRDPNVPANNLGGSEAVTTSATSVTVAFAGLIQGNDYSFTSGPTASGTGNTLPAGTYYYAVTRVTKNGETGIGAPTTSGAITVAAGQKVDMTIANPASAAYPARFYRGTLPGIFDGYFQTVAGTTFSDTGQAFTNYDTPMLEHWDVPSRAEIDANYSLVCTPSWNTTCWPSAKATGGFTINFGTAAPAGATVSWLLFRP